MGKQFSRFCTECFEPEGAEENSIPLLEKPESSYIPMVDKHNLELEEQKFEVNHPKQAYLFNIIENACSEFLSHVNCEFNEPGFAEALKKDNLHVIARESEKGYVMKSEYFLECSPQAIIKLLLDIDARKSWDDNVEKIDLVLNLPQDTSVTYIKFKKMLIIASRDILVVNRVLKVNNGWAFVSASCEMEDFPEVQDTIRAVVDVSGYYMESTNTEKCRIIGYTKGDAGGKIPKALVKTATVTALPKFINSLQRAAKKIKT